MRALQFIRSPECVINLECVVILLTAPPRPIPYFDLETERRASLNYKQTREV